MGIENRKRGSSEELVPLPQTELTQRTPSSDNHPSQTSKELTKRLTPAERLAESITDLFTREQKKVRTMTYPVTDEDGKK
ncbi:MAG TPA: hypothetical protein VE090_00200, partial [Methylomirabilota bacterium]|nr:hypothetical protein [Methylomirabilota bacterium]